MPSHREEDFDNALPALLPAPLGEERPSCTTPRPFRGGARGGVNQKRSYPIVKYVVTVFISSTPNPSSQEEGNVDGVPSHPGGGECRRSPVAPRRRGMSTKSRRTQEEGNVDGVPSHPGGGECRRTQEEGNVVAPGRRTLIYLPIHHLAEPLFYLSTFLPFRRGKICSNG